MQSHTQSHTSSPASPGHTPGKPTRRWRRPTWALLAAVLLAGGTLWATPADEPATLSPTRLLRRVHLTLTGHEPSLADYQAMQAAPDAASQEALITQAIDAGFQSDGFKSVLLTFAHDLLKNGSYDFDTKNKISWAINLGRCGDDTLHAGKLGMLARYSPIEGDGPEVCDDENALVSMVSPWWAPDTTIAAVGRAGNGVTTTSDGYDCGKVRLIFGSAVGNHIECGCGPNMRFCARPHRSDVSNNIATSIRRSVFEEPAHLVQHVILNDAPFSDVIAGDYTVVNQGLHFMYLRTGRQAGRNLGTDTDDSWAWLHAADPHTYKPVPFAELADTFTSARSLQFDPRTDMGSLPAMPAAGVLTTFGMLGSGERERVRASRALETFACREFIPPPPELHFNPYQRDPGTEGACQHCHQLIDPAAIHFKRFAPSGKQIWGMDPWRWGSHNDFGRNLEAAFDTDTYMTPVTAAEVAANPDARFLDFLPPNKTLLGQTSDGTVGPLGFAKMLIASGAFDRCMVRRFYAQFGGRPLTPGLDDALIEDLTTGFVASGRNAKQLIRTIVTHPEFRLGL